MVTNRRRYSVLACAILFAAAGSMVGCAGNQAVARNGSPMDEANAGGKGSEAILQGDKALQAGNMDLALFHYVNALNADSSDADTLYKVAYIHDAKGDLALAEQAYRGVLERMKNHGGALEGLGLVLLRRQEFGAAEENLRAAIAADPSRWRAHDGLGVLADLRGAYPEAQGHYDEALKIRPDMPLVLNNYGYSRYLAGDWRTARTLFERALNKDQKFAKAWANLGLLHVRGQEFEQARRAFREIMDEAQAFYNIGYICMISGDDAHAQQYFEKAVRASPSYYASAHENLERVQARAARALSAGD